MDRGTSPGELRPSDTGERREHIRVVGALEAAGLVYHHSPNGELRDARVAATLRRMGTQPGFPDLIILTPPPARPGCPAVALELKRPALEHGDEVATPPWAWGEFTEHQQLWLASLEELGWCSLVAWTAEGAVEQLRDLGYDVSL